MKSGDERAAERASREVERLAGAIAGRSADDLRAPGSPALRQLDWFKPHPANEVFDSAKTDRYWRDLERDIREAGRIIDPVVSLPDGTLIEGHSRVTIARKLASEGMDLGRIPTVVLDVSEAEAERRVYLGNLSRFELDEDTRLALYVKVWPDYFLEAHTGRPKKEDTVSTFSGESSPPRRDDIAAATGRSGRQVRRDRAVIREAADLATHQGKALPGPEEIRTARERALERRRSREPRAANGVRSIDGSRIPVDLSAEEIEEILMVLKQDPNGSEHRREIVGKLEMARDAWRRASEAAVIPEP